MEIILFTVVAVVLYLLSDWIVQRVEIAAGRRLEHRTLIFFALISVLAVTTFTLLRSWLASP
ncbi:MAG: hypothetical protein U5R46_06980 [Gammaproteobacteria bacterium]|nr:hypothetical protein [Gammaproteobacteria bacterium]